MSAPGSAAVPIAQVMPDLNESGRVLADLNDWRAIVFVLIIVIVILLLEKIWTTRETRIERQAMRDLANSFATSADKVGEALANVRVELQVLRILAARLEGRTVSENEHGHV